MRALDEAGRVKFVNMTGGHLDITDDEMKKYVVPYLVDEEAPKNQIMIGSSSEATRFIRKLSGQQYIQLNGVHRL